MWNVDTAYRPSRQTYWCKWAGRIRVNALLPRPHRKWRRSEVKLSHHYSSLGWGPRGTHLTWRERYWTELLPSMTPLWRDFAYCLIEARIEERSNRYIFSFFTFPIWPTNSLLYWTIRSALSTIFPLRVVNSNFNSFALAKGGMVLPLRTFSGLGTTMFDPSRQTDSEQNCK